MAIRSRQPPAGEPEPGGSHPPPAGPYPAGGHPPAHRDLAANLGRLAQLREQELLTQEEYEAARARLFGF